MVIGFAEGEDGDEEYCGADAEEGDEGGCAADEGGEGLVIGVGVEAHEDDADGIVGDMAEDARPEAAGGDVEPSEVDAQDEGYEHLGGVHVEEAEEDGGDDDGYPYGAALHLEQGADDAVAAGYLLGEGAYEGYGPQGEGAEAGGHEGVLQEVGELEPLGEGLGEDDEGGAAYEGEEHGEQAAGHGHIPAEGGRPALAADEDGGDDDEDIGYHEGDEELGGAGLEVLNGVSALAGSLHDEGDGNDDAGDDLSEQEGSDDEERLFHCWRFEICRKDKRN